MGAILKYISVLFLVLFACGHDDNKIQGVLTWDPAVISNDDGTERPPTKYKLICESDHKDITVTTAETRVKLDPGLYDLYAGEKWTCYEMPQDNELGIGEPSNSVTFYWGKE